MRAQPTIMLIYTGGTIGMIKDFETGALRNFDFDELLNHIPELKLLDCTIETVSFKKPIDSSDMNTEAWIALAEIIESQYHRVDGFVILHGSDTMSFSASALSFMLENLDKPVIFTGSQLPIGDLRTDAKENLITSIQIAALRENNQPVIREVGLYFEYKLFRGNRTTKISAEHFEAFTSMNYPPLAESGMNLTINRELLFRPNLKKPLIVHKELETRILVIKMFPGIDKNTFEYLTNYPHVQALIIETYGTGNVTTESWFLQKLRTLTAREIPIINITQCEKGSVMMGLYETSTELKKIGIISGKDINFEAAIAKTMYLLGKKLSLSSFKTFFETSLRGEMD
ncbi:MAG: asparaginase [Bacteroidetes bacterium]|jgi:L-asparaginase|nr:asparaginase [Bacteroidota bacterium]